ncbi:protein phosphatase 2C domain-containing protein [Jatrophihabitans sp.]|uniref:PP2C family protein-serine/threonine phosphatase n=1 Tax=Jatrophihabitans sp. TaxID=1932789 RepID=UPI0030C722A2|nr:Protein serine/threonine phosphatase [Jatrophihabitans sp.]
MLTFTAGAATDTGRVRSQNEDSLLTAEHFVAVADGMGGHAAGDVASRLAVQRLAELDRQPAPRPTDVLAAIAAMNAEILRSAADNSARAGMGTTLAGVGVVRVGGSEHWIVFNVGDSRVYRYFDGALSQVTVDHSEVEELRAAGRLTAAEARDYARRNIVTRSLGSDPAPEPDMWVFPPTSAERFVVCSDGLTLELEEAEIVKVLREQPDAQAAADTLVAHALAAGGRDNVTAIVVNLDIVASRSGVDADTAPRIRDAEGR